MILLALAQKKIQAMFGWEDELLVQTLLESIIDPMSSVFSPALP
jgi:hypothetical protein